MEVLLFVYIVGAVISCIAALMRDSNYMVISIIFWPIALLIVIISEIMDLIDDIRHGRLF